MRRLIPVLFCIVCSFAAYAQQQSTCAINKFFVLQAGVSKDSVIHTVERIYSIKPYTDNGTAQNNSTIKSEVILYKLNNSNCFSGTNTLIRFEFENGKLFKATIQSTFENAAYYDLQDNINTLRAAIKPNFEKEKQTQSSSTKFISTGYTFSNKRSKAKTELNYLSEKSKTGIYLLQLTWVNEHNDGIEKILD